MNNKKGFKTILLTLIGGLIGGLLVFILFLGFHFFTLQQNQKSYIAKKEQN